MKTAYGFSRRGPDILGLEIATVLSAEGSFEFKELFNVVYLNLKARNAANGGEEMLRLRTYEKLQNLVAAGVAEKVSKRYQGIASGLADFLEIAAALKVTFAAAKNGRTLPPALALAV